MKGIFDYINQVKLEMSKVIWPKKDQVVRLTLIVFITSGIIGAYVGLLDYIFTKLLEILVST